MTISLRAALVVCLGCVSRLWPTPKPPHPLLLLPSAARQERAEGPLWRGASSHERLLATMCKCTVCLALLASAAAPGRAPAAGAPAPAATSVTFNVNSVNDAVA